MAEARTRRGRRMNPVIRARIVRVLTDPANQDLSRVKLAKAARVSARTFHDYVTREVEREVEALVCAGVTPKDLLEVDRAMLVRAREGSVAAAKLLYLRAATLRIEDLETRLPTLAELEAELANLKQMEREPDGEDGPADGGA